MSPREIEELICQFQNVANIIDYKNLNRSRVPVRARRCLPSKMIITEGEIFEIELDNGAIFHFNGFGFSEGVLSHVRRRAKRRFKGESNEPTCYLGN